MTDSRVALRRIPVSPNDDYRAGSDGRIYSRTKYKGFGRKVYVEWYPLQGYKNAKGYTTVSMCHNNEKVTQASHRLVCMAFHGLPPTKKHQTQHLDGNPANNKPANLRWGTQYENWQDRKRHGRGCEGEKHHAAKFTSPERAHIRWAIQKRLCSQRHAAEMLNVSQSSIGGIVHSKSV